ncbi:MAG: cytochrome d ubiquinol oxidase subunit II [Gammaproteobacteria bacterium]
MNPNELIYVWYGILLLSLVLYVALDGFDLGIGCLMLWNRDAERREAMLDTLSPVWDANETWLVLAGGVLFGAFPAAYAAIAPALYGPLMLLLFALMLRGVGFEFVHFAADRERWLRVFAWASLVAAVLQGVLLAALLNGLSFADGFLPLSALTIPALVAGYALFGACYLLAKTAGEMQQRAFRYARYSAAVLAPFVVLSAYWLPGRSFEWTSASINLGLFALLFYSLQKRRERLPYVCTLLLLAVNAAILAYVRLPDLLPGVMTLQQAASSPATLRFMLAVIGPLLPLILIYNTYQYWVFRGKSEHAQQ